MSFEKKKLINPNFKKRIENRQKLILTKNQFIVKKSIFKLFRVIQFLAIFQIHFFLLYFSFSSETFRILLIYNFHTFFLILLNTFLETSPFLMIKFHTNLFLYLSRTEIQKSFSPTARLVFFLPLTPPIRLKIKKTKKQSEIFSILTQRQIQFVNFFNAYKFRPPILLLQPLFYTFAAEINMLKSA